MRWVSATPTVTPLTGNVGTWTIAKIAHQDSAIITIQAKIIAVGVSLNNAVVTTANGSPIVSPPSR
ncbi:MAG: hypothetical protein R2822_12605 [Spirosomataceae bacterium]